MVQGRWSGPGTGGRTGASLGGRDVEKTEGSPEGEGDLAELGEKW